MRRTLHLAILAMVSILAAHLNAAELVDRIVATVNGAAILESDWDQAVRFECFLEQKPLTSLTAEDIKVALERLIDQTLIQQQMQSAKTVVLSQEQVGERVRNMHEQSVRNWLSYSPAKTWTQALTDYGLSEEEFETRAAMQVQTLRFIDLRFRPGIHIDHRQVETYYREKLLPELQRNGAKETALAEISPKIEELLVQQTMDEMLTAWLRNLRAQSEVEVR